MDVKPVSITPPAISPQRPTVVSEPRDRYVTGGFHPVTLGETYNNRYLVLGKLGFGRYSTVWLSQDIKFRSVRVSFSYN
jgi:serine/threonine-protein kinase SRPK3